MSVSTIYQDIQRPVDAHLPTCGHLPFFSEEAEVKMVNASVAIQLLKACVTRHEVMTMANYMQKVTPTSKIFKNESVFSGWYQACLSKIIAKGILKISSGNVPHYMKREAWFTSSNQ